MNPPPTSAPVPIKASGRTRRNYRQGQTPVLTHNSATFAPWAKVVPVIHRICGLFRRGRTPLPGQGPRFNGHLIDQMREDVFVLMHQIGPTR
jgi:hypothetical protein